MKKILKDLNINETYTKPLKKPIYDKVKSNTFPMQDYNFMMDLLFLPTTKKKNKYLLVVVDLWSDDFDIEPLKDKEPASTLTAFKKMIKRPHINLPEASIRTDNGTEFKGVFSKYLYDKNILHRIAEPYRHQQLANVENLNKTLGKIFNGYMNTKEEELGYTYNEWDDIIDYVRKELNKIRHRPDGDPYNDLMEPSTEAEPKYEVGDLVYRKLERPKNALGHNQTTINFRMGDYRFDVKQPRKIKKILYYPNNIRYLLEGHTNVSYTEAELKPSEEQAEKYIIKKVLDKRKIEGKTHYLIWWKGYLKKKATWEPLEELIKDGYSKQDLEAALNS